MNALTELKNLRIPFSTLNDCALKLRQLEVEYDLETRSLWTYMKQTGNACFNLGLLQDDRIVDQAFRENGGRAWFNGELLPVDYTVLASRTPNIFNNGGDLALFVLLIKSRDREALLNYATLCVEGVHARCSAKPAPTISICLIQGDALGGGLEVALTGDIIIAEEQARLGFPEILFNLFPGMGAYSLLCRRVGMKKTEEIILSGKIYEAGELHEMGLIDIIAPCGHGENAVYSFIRDHSKRFNGMRALFQTRQHALPVTYDELMRITETWVDAALNLTDRDLKMMGRLVRAQMRQQELRRNGQPLDSLSRWPDGE